MPQPKCDTCDKPATTRVVDVQWKGLDSTGAMKKEPYGKIRNGCADHPVRSEEYNEAGVLIPK